MDNIAILAGGDSTLLPRDHDVYVGVDGGCLKLLEQGLPLDIAVGDFDSVSETDLRKIRTQAKQVVQSVPEKNDTDLELALKAAFEAYPDAAVTVYGAFGGRLDHFLSNIFFADRSRPSSLHGADPISRRSKSLDLQTSRLP